MQSIPRAFQFQGQVVLIRDGPALLEGRQGGLAFMHSQRTFKAASHVEGRKMHSRRTFTALAAIGLGMAVYGQALGQVIGADLNVAPKRIVLSPQTNTAVIYVFNRGGASATYNIDLIDRIMTSDGQIIPVDTVKPASPEAATAAGLKSAKTMITFSPRRVTLQAGESQIVRLRILRPAGLANGEYRSHLTVTAVPPDDAGLTADQAAGAPSGQVTTRIISLFAISIPVIVRQGAADPHAVLQNIQLVSPAAGTTGSVLALDLVRQGANSLFGDVEVQSATAPRGAEPLGALRGIGVYSELGQRAVRVNLSRAPNPGERLQVVFKDQDVKTGQVLATMSYTAP